MTSLKNRLLLLNVAVVLLALLVATGASYWDSRGHLRRQTLAHSFKSEVV